MIKVNLTKLCLEHWVSCISFHVVGWLFTNYKRNDKCQSFRAYLFYSCKFYETTELSLGILMDLGGFHVEPCLTSLKLFNHTNSNNENSCTSLKSPILGMWFFLVFPRTEPLLEIITEKCKILFGSNNVSGQIDFKEIILLD